MESARSRGDAEYALVDVNDYQLPLLDEPKQPARHEYVHPHTERWSERIASFDGFVFVTPEYNHGPPAALKNAVDFLFDEWTDKPVAFVGYGVVGAVRAIEQLRLLACGTNMASVRECVALTWREDFRDLQDFEPADRSLRSLHHMLDRLNVWSTGFREIRAIGAARRES